MMKNYYFLIGIFIAIGLLFSNQLFAQASKNTIAQIQLLLQEKQSRTPVQQKISSQLLQAVREKAGKQMVKGISLNAANVDADTKGFLLVDINAMVTDSLLTSIHKLGGKVIFASEKYNSIRAEINLSDVEKIAAFKSVKYIGPAVESSVLNALNPNPSDKPAKRNINPFVNIPSNKSFTKTAHRPLLKERTQRVQTQLERYLNSGTVNSQGDHAHRADDVRTTYGAQGQGIKIGIISDSYNAKGGASLDVLNGNLPGTGNPFGYTTPVTVLADFTDGDDEGRAMLQIVHDLAPKAQLFFATGKISEASFATNITTLKNTYNCDIIIDDILYNDEPQFQDGIVAQAVNVVTAAGALYFSAAGNEGSVTKNTSGLWEGDFNDVGSLAFVDSTIQAGKKAGTIHNWGTSAAPINGNIVTAMGSYYVLTWSDAYNASANDYDLFLINSAGDIKAYSADIQNGTQQPLEGFRYQTLEAGYRLVVFKEASAQIRAFSLNTFGGRLTKSTAGQTHGHSAAVDAFSVAAASALQTNGNPFSTGNVIENFSSDGLRRIFYNADGTAITPGNVLFSTGGGVVRNKPDITAADGVSTSFPLNEGFNPFYGTSGAAAHAGAIAALIKSIQPTITAAQMRALLTSTALDIEATGYDNISGFGIVQAFQAMQSLNPAPVADVSLGSFTPVENTGSNGNGGIDPGEPIKLIVNLKNTSPITANSVTGILSSSTTGVTITNSLSNYGNLLSSSSADNTAIPFTFNVATSVACGAQLNFILTVNFENGTSPQSFPIVLKVGNPVNIIGSLGSPAASTSQFTSSTGLQTGRVNRFSPASVCGTLKSNPGLNLAATGNRAYDAYVFTNATNVTQCITVKFSTTSINSLNTEAYNENGFVPATPNINFLADSGGNASTQSFGFSVNAGKKYTVVVHALAENSAFGTQYSLNVNGSFCSNVVLPVNWLSFTTVEKNGQAALEWKVANEINVNNYEVEHSTDGSHFTKIYNLPAQTNMGPEKTYMQIHPFPDQGNNYYRIKEVDKDGQFVYSKTALVVFSKVNDVLVAPTIASSFVKVQSKNTMDGIKLYNTMGQLIMNIVPASTSYTLPINNLAAGVYYLQIITANKTYQQKIIKE